MSRFPVDIWYRVAQYLPPETILAYKDVISAFKDLATAAKYRALTIERYDKDTKRTLRELCNPSLATAVHSIHITPWLITASSRKSCPGKRRRLLSAMKSIFNPNLSQKQDAEFIQKRLAKHVRSLSGSIQSLPEVFNYILDWDEESYHEEFYNALLAPLLACSFGGHLVKLSLKVPPERLASLASVQLPSLQELEVQFSTSAIASDEINHLLDGFIVFVNNLDTSLRSLSIRTTRQCRFLDLSMFFHWLGTFHKLSRFHVALPPDGTHIRDLTPLRQFIAKHTATLEDLHIGISFNFFKKDMFEIPPPDAELWIIKLTETLKAPALRSLHLSIRPLRTPLVPVLSALARHGPQLEHLALTDRDLSYDEVRRILDALNQPNLLQSLTLTIQHISSELIDLLAERLSELRSLELRFQEIIHSENQQVCLDRLYELREFESLMRRRRYPSWKLQEMSFPECRIVDVKWVKTISKVIFEAVPSLQHVSVCKFDDF